MGRAPLAHVASVVDAYPANAPIRMASCCFARSDSCRRSQSASDRSEGVRASRPKQPCVDVKVLAQPYRESEFTGQTFINTALHDENVQRLLIVTAWVRTSGMRLLVPGLEALRQRGGSARLLVGVDLRGTSRQGVALAREHFNDVYAIHDPGGGTFHPKMYLAVGERIGYALIGSNNLTAGGLWHNYEVAMTSVFEPRRDSEVMTSIEAYAERLIGDTAICKRVTEGVFGRLMAEGWLTDEARDRRRNEDRPSRAPRREADAGPPLFAQSAIEKRDRPAPLQRDPTRQRVPSRRRRRLATSVDSWWKPLGAGDAQHPLVGHPTGNVALTHTPTGHDRETFFRDVFFGAERWHGTTDVEGRQTELATITAEVEIGGEELGSYELTVVFRRYRGRRGRATTVLRWGAVLPELRARNLTGWHLLIERGDVGAYRVRFMPQEPG
jgi:HKD family nuclease